MNFAGMQVFVSRPVVKTVNRTWRERLLSWPWSPLVRIKTVVIPAAIPTDQCYKVGGDLHCGEQVYEQLKQATKEADSIHKSINWR